MNSNKSTNLSDDRKRLLRKDLKEGFQGLKEIIVAAITVVLRFTDSLTSSRKSSSITAYKFNESRQKANSWLSTVNEDNKNTSSEPLNVAIDIDHEKSNDFTKQIIQNIFYPLLAALSTTTLVLGVAKIDPLIEWAETQNECIKSNSEVDGMTSTDLATKVMTCNGGHAN